MAGSSERVEAVAMFVVTFLYSICVLAVFRDRVMLRSDLSVHRESQVKTPALCIYSGLIDE